MINQKDVLDLVTGFLYLLIFNFVCILVGLIWYPMIYSLAVIDVFLVILIWLQRDKYKKHLDSGLKGEIGGNE